MLRKTLSVIFATLLVLTLFVGCNAGNANPPTDTDTPSQAITDDTKATTITITDMTGRTVSLEKPAQKIVVLTASTGEIVYALGAGSTIVGHGAYCDWPPEITSTPAVQSGSETNIEQIVALQPDLVLMDIMDQTQEQVSQLEHAGITVYASKATDIAGTYTSIQQIGKLLGKEADAAQLIDTMRATFDEIAAKKLTGTVYFEVSPLEQNLWTAGKGTFMDEVATLIGLENVFSDLDGWAEISEEAVLQRNPDYIVTIGMYSGSGPLPDEEIRARPNWQNVTAVKSGKVLHLANNELSRPGPRIAEGAKALYDFANAK